MRHQVLLIWRNTKMYLVQVIEKVKDDFDIMTETFETEDEARKWF